MNTLDIKQTLVMIKPDAFERELVQMIRDEIQNAGFTITLIGQITFTLDLVREFYRWEKVEWPETVRGYLCSKPIPLWLVEGKDVIARMMEIKWRIRRTMCTSDHQNLLHCSSNKERFRWEYSVLMKSGMIVPRSSESF